jgi:hypothetical protein
MVLCRQGNSCVKSVISAAKYTIFYCTSFSVQRVGESYFVSTSKSEHNGFHGVQAVNKDEYKCIAPYCITAQRKTLAREVSFTLYRVLYAFHSRMNEINLIFILWQREKLSLGGTISLSNVWPLSLPTSEGGKCARWQTLQRKGTQDWDFFWLRFWNLYYFFVSYVKILRFYKIIFLLGPFWGEVRFFHVVLGLREIKIIFNLGQKIFFFQHHIWPLYIY